MRNGILMKRMALILLLLVTVLLVAGVAFIEVRQSEGNLKAKAILADFEVRPVEELGSTRTLRVLPLVDYHTSDPALRTEVGVSYLIDTDDHRILFDVGQNTNFESPSPLESNMGALGIDLASIDIVFVSHNHSQSGHASNSSRADDIPRTSARTGIGPDAARRRRR